MEMPREVGSARAENRQKICVWLQVGYGRNMSTSKNRWVIGFIAALCLGTAVGASAARGGGDSHAAVVESLKELPMPALDRTIARLAAEARTGISESR